MDPGLAYTDGKAAVFAWGGTTLTYGEQTGYTLPLNKHELYEVTYKIAAWRDGTWPTKTSVTLDGVIQEKTIKVPGMVNNAEGNPFLTVKFYVSPTEDNSILKIYANQHFVIADLSMKQAVAENITIDEDANYTPAETYANVTLKRKFKVGEWNSFVVPFDIIEDQVRETFGQGVEIAEFSDEGDSENAVTVNFTKMVTPTITANKPVMIKPTNENLDGGEIRFNAYQTKEGSPVVAGKYFDFTGTYAASENIAAGDYFLNGSKIFKSSGSTAIKGTRAYLKNKGNAQSVKLFIDGITTSIDALDVEPAANDGAIYNLAGQRVEKAQKGLYIVNGKKVLVK